MSLPIDPYSDTQDSITSSADVVFVVTPHDTALLPYVTKAIRVGTAGDMCVETTKSSGPVIIPNLLAGDQLCIRAIRILATGTTASGITGMA